MVSAAFYLFPPDIAAQTISGWPLVCGGHSCKLGVKYDDCIKLPPATLQQSQARLLIITLVVILIKNLHALKNTKCVHSNPEGQDTPGCSTIFGCLMKFKCKWNRHIWCWIHWISRNSEGMCSFVSLYVQISLIFWRNVQSNAIIKCFFIYLEK